MKGFLLVSLLFLLVVVVAKKHSKLERLEDDLEETKRILAELRGKGIQFS